MPNRKLILSILIAAPLIFAGCDTVRKQVGFVKDSGPDEFTVVTKAPLVIPPDYSLRPPQPGAPRPQEATPSQKARDVLIGSNPAGEFSNPSPQPGDPLVVASVAEASLLKAAGAANAMPNIREIVKRETSELEERDSSFVDSLIFWQEPQPSAEQVDALNESKRLQGNAATGRPTTEGETPLIQRRRRGILEGLFN